MNLNDFRELKKNLIFKIQDLSENKNHILSEP